MFSAAATERRESREARTHSSSPLTPTTLAWIPPITLLPWRGTWIPPITCWIPPITLLVNSSVCHVSPSLPPDS